MRSRELSFFPLLQSLIQRLASDRCSLDFPGGSVVKNPPASAGDTRDLGSIPGSGRSLGGGNGNPLQYFCLENSVDRGARQAIVHGVAKSEARLSN